MEKKFLIEEENKKIKLLKFVIDASLSEIYQSKNLNLIEAYKIFKKARKIATILFPDSELTFDLIYKKKFFRAIMERFPFS